MNSDTPAILGVLEFVQNKPVITVINYTSDIYSTTTYCIQSKTTTIAAHVKNSLTF